MQYSKLGDTGLLVSRLCFGAMSFHDEHGMGSIAKVRGKDADAMIGRTLDAGINFFDTADVYSAGESETMLGAALKSRRNEVIIATKVGMRTGKAVTTTGLSRRHILWSVDQSLRRLGTDWIDVYICHREDAATPVEETLQALDDVVRAGKVRYLGFSNWSAWAVSAALEMQKANDWARFTHGQMYYSMLCRDIEFDVIPMMRKYGVGLTAWSPLAGGFLSGKYTRESQSDPANRRTGFDFPPVNLEQGFALLDVLRPIAQRHGASVAQVALAWIFANPATTSILIGATKLSQIEDNLGAIDVKLTAEDLQAIDVVTKLAPRYPNWFDSMVNEQTMRAAMGR